MRRLLPLLLVVACSDYGFTPEDAVDRPAAEDNGTNPGEDNTDPGDDTDDHQVEGEPIADAGPDQNIKPLDWVSLDGTASVEPNGLYPLDYRWSIVSVPDGSQATLVDRGTGTPRFWADLAGDYTFELTVGNTDGVWDSTPDTVTITAEPTDGFYVQLSWDNDTDQDLHLMRSGAQLYRRPGDCNYCDMNPSWGSAGTLDDPSLDYDTIDGYGPETTTIESPSPDTYRIAVVYYGEGGAPYCFSGCPATTATVRLFMNGTEVRSWSRVLRDAGDVWTVADIEWPSQRITDVDRTSFTELTSCF